MKVRVLRPFVSGEHIYGAGEEITLEGDVSDEVMACVEVLDTKMAKPANKTRSKKVKECQ